MYFQHQLGCQEDFNHHVGRVVAAAGASGRVGVALHGAIWASPASMEGKYRRELLGGLSFFVSEEARGLLASRVGGGLLPDGR